VTSYSLSFANHQRHIAVIREQQPMCLWPPNNVTQRCKKEEFTDTDLWKKYEIKVLAVTGGTS
jgi:hypothetical protein